MDRFNSLRAKNRLSYGSRDPQSFDHVVVGLLIRQRNRLTAQHDALAKLSQLRLIQLLFQLGLTRQYDLQQLLGGGLQVGQEPDLFQNGMGQVLGFVHDEHGSFTSAITIEKPLIEPHQLLTLDTRLARNAKLRKDEI